MSPEHTPAPVPKQEMIEVPEWNENEPKVETVSVERSDGTIEDNWVVAGVDDGSVIVRKTEGGVELTKRVSRSKFESLNGTIEASGEFASNETSDALGEVALDGAGLGDIENARIFKPGELRALMGESNEASEPDVLENDQEVEVDASFEALPAEVRGQVLEYRTAVANQAESRRIEDYAQAADDGRYIFAVRQRLSQEAKKHLGL